MPILVYAEQRDGRIRATTLEAISAARHLSDEASLGEVSAVLPAAQVEAPDSLGAFGADRVWIARHESFGLYQPDGYAAAVLAAQKKLGGDLLLFAASALGKDLAPRVAARLDVGVAADCTRIEWRDGALEAVRPVYAGKALQTVRTTRAPAVATLRPLAFPAREARAGARAPVEDLEFALDANPGRVIVTEVTAAPGAQVDLTESEIIVSGGRGLRGPENFHLVEELAAALGGTVGASRAVVDAGWRPHDEQVGQTGKTVSPKLYVAIGISGAIQHLAGMSSARCIVAINKDADAPIFKVADYGIVGDAFQVVPAFTQAVRRLRAG
jgi:electron transfer flavoprotein alpha subunit